MKKYTIVLEDGTEIVDLELNGNNFISHSHIDKSIFENNLGSVLIVDENAVEKHGNMILTRFDYVENDTWFALRDVSDNEMFLAKLRADIDYIAMMTDVEF